jgi:predicted porin
VADVYGRYTGNGLDAMLSVVDDKADSLGQNLRTVSAAAAYDWGNYRFNGGVMQVNDRGAADRDGKGYWLGASYRLGQHLFKGQYVESKNDGALLEGKTQAFGVGYQYDLSKRTALYSSVTRFKNEGVGYTSRAAGTIPVGLTDADHRNLTEVVAGIRHSF